MKIVILGGDGFCGWATALHLSSLGHEIIIIDNLSRRKIDIELEVDSLTPISSINTRLKVWKEVTGSEIRFVKLDIAKEYDLLLEFLRKEKPDSVVHFAEQNPLHIR